MSLNEITVQQQPSSSQGIHNQFTSSVTPKEEKPQTTSSYYATESQQNQQPTQVSSSGLAFDLNAVGDEEDEIHSQMMNQIYKESSDETSEKDEVDRRSVFVGNVDYGSTPPELQDHFKNCGAINRITIMVDRYTGHPKGYAYIEFQDETAIPNAVSLNDSTFRDRQLKVTAKRKNVPGLSVRGRGGLLRGSPTASLHYMGRSSGPFRGPSRGMKRGSAAMGYFPRYRGRGLRGVYPY